jgi:DNA repair exonuclease SbcCD nuclease subunit
MKILCCGDQHITNKKPRNRTDDYYRTVLGKLRQEFQIAKEEECSCVLLPGDVFDTYKENHHVAQEVMKIIQKSQLMVFAIAGQHDQQFHNPDLTGTTLGTLVTAGVINILSANPTPITNGVAIYGASWNELIPEITTPDRLNILVLHKMIVDEKLWAEQEGHVWANHMLIQHKFDLIVSGDNHTQFFANKGNRHLINLGSMMRSTIAQLNHRPAVAVYDTDTKEVDIIDLDYKPFDEVMQLDRATKEKEHNENMDSFVKSLKKGSGEVTKLDFVAALKSHIEVNNTDEAIQTILFDCLED